MFQFLTKCPCTFGFLSLPLWALATSFNQTVVGGAYCVGYSLRNYECHPLEVVRCAACTALDPLQTTHLHLLSHLCILAHCVSSLLLYFQISPSRLIYR